jgi:hypothetical protein
MAHLIPERTRQVDFITSAASMSRSSLVTSGLMPNQSVKPRTGLVQQHVEAVGGPEAALLGRFQQLGFERDVDDVGDHRILGHRRQIDLELRLALSCRASWR